LLHLTVSRASPFQKGPLPTVCRNLTVGGLVGGRRESS
jgi:hypothetical protein